MERKLSGVDSMTAMAPTFPNSHCHPELVSGSMVPFALSGEPGTGTAMTLTGRASACGDKWTLKRVQGDGTGPEVGEDA